MVIGQSRYFSLAPASGVNIAAYSAVYKLFKNGELKKSGAVLNTGTVLKVSMQTNDLTSGSYELRVFITDPVDGFVDMVKDQFTLEK